MTDDFIKSDALKAGAQIEPQPLKIGYGLALNIQPEQVGAALYELKTGQLLVKTEAPNALQQFGGAEFSLIDYAKNEKKALQLTAVLREQVFDLMLEMLKQAEEQTGRKVEEQTGEMAGEKTGKSWSPQDVHYVAVAGTTLMQHLFAAMNPSGLGKLPPKPVSLFGEEIFAEPTMYFCPCVSASIGGDIIAAQMVLGVHRKPSQHGRETIKTRNEAALQGAGLALTETGRQKLKKTAREFSDLLWPVFGNSIT